VFHKEIKMKKILHNKTCLITGATSGIGRSAAIEMSKMGAEICFIARNPEKAEELNKEIVKLTGKETFYIKADLSSLKEIERAASEFINSKKDLHILLNNAGIVNTERKVTVDGIEEVFAVNHLSYFALTLRLLDKLKESSPARVVNVSSAAHKFVRNINFDDINSENSFQTFSVYGQSKLANILFTRKLSSLLKGSNITVNCLHPGWVSTSLGQQNNRTLMSSLMGLFSPLLAKNSLKGAETSIFLCSSDEVSEISGEYFANCKIQEVSKGAKDKNDQETLWDLSLQLTKLKNISY